MALYAKGLLVLAGFSFTCTPLDGQVPAPPTKSPVMVYDRRPLRVPVACRAEDFEAAGIVCSEEEPCQIFLELTAVEALGPTVLIAGNIHTPLATLSSIALLSDDAGTTWREPTERAPGKGFEAVQFLDGRQMWISAQNHGAFPSDPYLLATEDGGGRWEALRIWNEEGRAGLLQQFYFESKARGFALIDRSAAGPVTDRYELYETLNGGRSWMLRETSSRPITPKWPPWRPPEWRLREDAKLRTYELERRLGDTWRRMANFRTDLGSCKEPEQKPLAPPVPEAPGAPDP